MENPYIAMNSALQVIKVVKLKRFMPETVSETIPKPKRHCYTVSKLESQKIYTEDKKHIESKQETVVDVEDALKSLNKEALVNRSKIKFRYCSHTPEELSKLHEHVDKTLVKLGDSFESQEALREHLNVSARDWHYYYVCRNSKKRVLEYNCICMAYSSKQRDVVIRNPKKRTTACPCKLRLTLDDVTNKMVVYYVCNHHDHPTTASAFAEYPHAKYLPHHVKEEFLDLTYAGLDVILIQKYIFSLIGLKIKKKDIWSYSYRFRKKVYQREFSDKRVEFITDLIKRIRDTFRESNFADVTEKTKNTGSTERELDINPNEMYENLGDNSLGKGTEVIVHINEDGVLCDQNVLLVTDPDIMEVINKYAYIIPDSNAKDEFTENVLNESVENRDSIDWEGVQGKMVSEDESYEVTEESENDKESIRVDSARNKIVIISDCIYKNRLPPTPATPAVYAEMDTFNKYYYIDHRYVAYEDQKWDKLKDVRQDCKVAERQHCLASKVVSEEYLKAPNYPCLPPLYRHCSGHDHLPSLADADAILPGAKFSTHEVFLSYVNDRAQRWFFYYSLVESGKFPENYVYKCVYGKHRVSKNAYRAKGIRKRNNLKTDCPCLVRLRRLESAPDHLTVLYSCNHHDHPLDEQHFNTQVHSRRLPPHMKEEIKDLLTLGVSSDLLRKYVLDKTALKISPKYFYNLYAGMRRRNEDRKFSEERLAILNGKVKELEDKFGNNLKAPSQDAMGDFTHGDLDEMGPFEEYSELTDFAEEVCIVQSDATPAEKAAKQSRMESRVQNISHVDITRKVRLQANHQSYVCDRLKHDVI